MTDAIIGGAIAAVIGAVGYAIIGLCQERRREKAQRLTIVDALIAEIFENLLICKESKLRELRWMAPFKLEAYNAYKGQIFFLSKDVCNRLTAAALTMELLNVSIQMYQSRAAFKQLADTDTMQIPEVIIKDIEFTIKELRKWRDKHSHCRLFNLVYAVYRRLRNFSQ